MTDRIYPLGDPDLIAEDTVANGYLTADADGVTLAQAYLDLRRLVTASRADRQPHAPSMASSAPSPADDGAE